MIRRLDEWFHRHNRYGFVHFLICGYIADQDHRDAYR